MKFDKKKLRTIADDLHADIAELAKADIEEELNRLDKAYRVAYEKRMKHRLDLKELAQFMNDNDRVNRCYVPDEEVIEASKTVEDLLMDKARYDLYF